MIEIAIICSGLLVWLLSGAASFVYWWTKDYDLTTGNLPTLLIASLIGPLAFWVGWSIHSKEGTRVLVSRSKERGE
jgi:hypothetical protein